MLQARLRAFSPARLPHRLVFNARQFTSSQTRRTLPRSPKWGVFSDIHFQQEDLSRIVDTSQWITDAFRRAEVTQIFCLGDVINTREHVNVQALSATASFFDELSTIAPVHIILGNHDMNLKHSSRVSSLDFFSSEGFRGSCFLYRNPVTVEVEGIKCYMVPWSENHSLVVERFVELSPEEKARYVLFGHLAVSGAIQQPSMPVTSRYRTHSGVLKGRHLFDFRGSYLGHFHHHQEIIPDKVWYIGAPMQHHFGDKSDTQRGVVLLEPAATPADQAPAMQFVQNPRSDFFREVSLQELKSSAGDSDSLGQLPFDVAGKRINIRCNAVDTALYETWRTRLMEAGASDVRRKVEIGRGIFSKDSLSHSLKDENGDSITSGDVSEPTKAEAEEDSYRAPSTLTFIEALPAFVSTIPPESDLIPPDQRGDYIATAERLMKLSDTTSGDHASAPTSTTNSSLPVFHATIRTLAISNFFSIQGTLTIPFSKLSSGTWFLTGPNGAGKSTILEAIVWALFGEVLRSDMTAADPVNDKVGKNCCVRVDFENGYSVERFRRYHSKASSMGPGLKLYKDGIEVPDFERGELRKSQQALEREILGCDYGTFTKSVILGDQGAGAANFLTLDSKQRRDVLEELLGISNFDAYLQTVRDEKKVAEKELIHLRSKSGAQSAELHRLQVEKERLSILIGPKESLKVKAEQETRVLKQEVAKFEEDRARIEREQGEMIESYKSYDKLYDQVQHVSESNNNIQAKLRLREEKIEETQRSLDKLAEFQPLCERWRGVQRELDRVQKAIQFKSVEHMNTLDRIQAVTLTLNTSNRQVAKGVCPTCHQTLDSEDHVQEHINELKCNLAKLEEKRTEIASKLGTMKAEQQVQEGKKGALLAELTNKQVTPAYLEALPEQQKQARFILQSNYGPLSKLQADLASGARVLQQLLKGKTMDEVAALAHRLPGQDVSSLQKAMNTHSSLMKRIQELSARRTYLMSSFTKLTTELAHIHSQLTHMSGQLTRLSAENEIDHKRVQQLEKNLRVLLFWETAFNKKQATTTAPNMRHFLLSTSIDELNTLIKSNMDILTNPTSFDTSDSSRIFDLPISFTPDLSIYPLSSFGKRSSGQRKRNNLAVLFALFQLIRQRSRFRADFIMLDEVFDALDKDGQIQAAELIAAVSSDAAGKGNGGEVQHVFVVTHSESLEDVVKVGHGGAGARVIKVQMGNRGTEIYDPEGVVEHVMGAVSGEEGIPVLELAPEKERGAKRSQVAGSQETEKFEGGSSDTHSVTSGEDGTSDMGPRKRKKKSVKRSKVLDAKDSETQESEPQCEPEPVKKRRTRKPKPLVAIEGDSTGAGDRPKKRATRKKVTEVEE